MRELAVIFFGMILVNNYVLVQFLGICPFLGVSKKLDSAFGMSCAVIFVMALATAVTWPVYTFCWCPAAWRICKPSCTSSSSPCWCSWWRSS